MCNNLTAEIELLNTTVREITEKLSQDAAMHKELSDRLDTEKAACLELKTQLLDKESHSIQLLEQTKSLNEQLNSLNIAHKGTALRSK